jgi:murein DD-endopeptidase MepM/ murein hydrolase activator NlpD
MGTVDQNGNYEANENFLAEMNGHDIAESVQSFNNANDNKPVKDSNDDSSNNRDGDDGKPAKEDRPSDLLGVALVGGALFATTVAGAFASNPSTPRPSTPNSGSSGQVNNPVRPMRRRDEDSDSDSNGGRKPTEAELDNFRNNIFFNTTKAETERILKKLESEGIDTSEMRKFAEEQRNRGVRNLTAEEIKVKNLEKELAKLQKELENASKLATDTISIPTTLSDADVNPMAYIVREQKRLEDLKRAKEAELNKIKNDPIYKNIVENANRNAELQIQLDNKKKDDIKKIEKEIRERISGRENVFNLNDPVNLEAYKNVFDNFKKIKTLLDCSLELQKLLKYEIKNESLAKIDEYYRARSDMFNFENFLFNKYKKELNLNTPIKEKEFREAVRLYKHSELLNARIIENNKNLPDKSEKGEIQLNPKVINPLTGKLGGTLTVNSGMGYRTLGGKPNIHYGFDLKPKNEVFSFTGGRIVGETLGSIETTPIGARGIYLNKDGNVCYLNSNEEETIHPDSESLKKKHAGKLDGYGNSITIKTLAKGQAFKVKYAHLEEPFKRKPDRIFLQQGDSIGISSSTGMSTGAHNHIEIEVVDPLKTEIPEQYLLKKGDKTYVDPIYYLNHIQGYQNEYEEGMNSFINNSPFTQNLDNPNLRFNN